MLLIYADDLGYGDVGCYGAERIATPHIGRLAREGLRFVNAYTTSATCTPSRYALLTGEYLLRRPGTGVLAGHAGLIIEPGRATLAELPRRAGYRTGVVGKWHLGLGRHRPDWNGVIAPGPLEIGFDYAFIMPATGDRVPCVYVENRSVVGLDPSDPIEVSYDTPIPGVPTARSHPDQVRMRPTHGHDQTIVNGIPRIGYMNGGTAALRKDEDTADEFVRRGVGFIESAGRPFFLYWAAHDPNVPRVPHPRFAGRTPLGPRGDAIVQFDECAGALLSALDRLGLADRTLVIFSSDNGPVLNDGYEDGAAERNGDHRPAGPLRGGKYSRFEAGCRVPFVVRWPGRVLPGVSTALVSQVDLPASLAALTGVELAETDAPDSLNVLPALLGESPHGREWVAMQGTGQLAFRRGDWKFLPPSRGPARNENTNAELGNAPEPQLYLLADDPGERRNLAGGQLDLVAAMAAELERIRTSGCTRPGARPVAAPRPPPSTGTP